MVANFVAGGAAINVLARQMGASVTVIDVGVATELDDAPGLLRRKVRPATADLAVEPAMTVDDVEHALDIGAEVAAELVEGGARAGHRRHGHRQHDRGRGDHRRAHRSQAADVTGRGTGIDDATLARKVAVVEQALGRLGDHRDGRTVLAEVGGLEIAALAGFIVGGAAASARRRRRRHRRRRAARRREPLPSRARLHVRRSSLDRTRRDRRARAPRARTACSISACASAKDRARASRCRCSKPARECSPRWPPSTARACPTRHDRDETRSASSAISSRKACSTRPSSTC